MASIFDCKNQEIRIGKTSITIKNPDTGKTKGVVRDVIKYKDMQPNMQIKYFKTLRRLGIWCNTDVDMEGVLVSNGEIIVLRNMRCDSENNEKRNSFYSELANNTTVIDCYY